MALYESYSLMLQLPDEAKELDKELRQITKQKNEAVRGQDFEKVH
jgi:ATP-dependent Clp protease ATP-binding subunit ClpC